MSADKRILVVSKDNHFINTIGTNLIKHSFQVKSTRAQDEELIRVLNETEPNLTILDTPLVSMDGIRQLIGIRGAMDTPIMMLSTQGAKADTVRTLSVGAYSHPFIKPITFEQLINQINNMLSRNDQESS
jgi:DNA-binding response OmpR family regulator